MPAGEKIAVIGAGTMGHGIAQVAATAGYEVALHDVEASFIERGLQAIRRNLDKGVEKGKVTAEQRQRTLAKLSAAPELEQAVAGTVWVIEAVPERVELKREIFAKVAASAPAEALFGSNTSSLSIASIAEGLEDRRRLIGLHFFNPVHLMALLEIVRQPENDDATVKAALDLAKRLGKEPIVVHDSPGFATSRLGLALGLEAIRMLESGVASAEDIDKAMTLGYRHPMGPLKLTDLIGLDVRLAIAEHLHRELGSEAFRPPGLLKRKVADGKLGRKSGEGFYTWST